MGPQSPREPSGLRWSRMGHWTYQSEQRLEMTLGAQHGSRALVHAGEILAKGRHELHTACWRGSSLSDCPFTVHATHMLNPFDVPSLH